VEIFNSIIMKKNIAILGSTGSIGKSTLKIIKNNTRGTAILNVGRGKLTYLDEIIKIFEKYVNKKIGYQKKLNEVGNYNYTLSNNTKLIKRLKYDYKFNLNDIIKSCIKKKLYDPT